MKENAYTSLICKKFCSYYKPGKEEEFCGGYAFLKENLTSLELSSIIRVFNLTKTLPSVHEVYPICNKCSFKEEGCDFIIKESNTPCGGYLIIHNLYKLLS